jgi:hypothetical protein
VKESTKRPKIKAVTIAVSATFLGNSRRVFFFYLCVYESLIHKAHNSNNQNTTSSAISQPTENIGTSSVQIFTKHDYAKEK